MSNHLTTIGPNQTQLQNRLRLVAVARLYDKTILPLQLLCAQSTPETTARGTGLDEYSELQDVAETIRYNSIRFN